MDSVIFQPFPKLARLARECVVTEKIDGTNAQIISKGALNKKRSWKTV